MPEFDDSYTLHISMGPHPHTPPLTPRPSHPALYGDTWQVDSYTLHLCYLMLIEHLAQPLEQWLIARTKTSLHFALQV